MTENGSMLLPLTNYYMLSFLVFLSHQFLRLEEDFNSNSETFDRFTKGKTVQVLNSFFAIAQSQIFTGFSRTFQFISMALHRDSWNSFLSNDTLSGTRLLVYTATLGVALHPSFYEFHGSIEKLMVFNLLYYQSLWYKLNTNRTLLFWQVYTFLRHLV